MGKFKYRNIKIHKYPSVTEYWCSNTNSGVAKLQYIEFNEIGFVEGKVHVRDLSIWDLPKNIYKVKLW